jgi:hypothetical protein
MHERNLLDLNDIKVDIEVSRCFEFTHPKESTMMLHKLLKWIQKNLDSLSVYNINKVALDNFIEKYELNMNYIIERDFYLKEANDRYKNHKGFSESAVANVGIPRSPFKVTLEELRNFYKCINVLEEEYDLVRGKNIVLSDSVYYFRSMEAIKAMLEKRMTYAIIHS